MQAGEALVVDPEHRHVVRYRDPRIASVPYGDGGNSVVRGEHGGRLGQVAQLRAYRTRRVDRLRIHVPAPEVAQECAAPFRRPAGGVRLRKERIRGEFPKLEECLRGCPADLGGVGVDACDLAPARAPAAVKPVDRGKRHPALEVFPLVGIGGEAVGYYAVEPRDLAIARLVPVRREPVEADVPLYPAFAEEAHDAVVFVEAVLQEHRQGEEYIWGVCFHAGDYITACA